LRCLVYRISVASWKIRSEFTEDEALGGGRSSGNVAEMTSRPDTPTASDRVAICLLAVVTVVTYVYVLQTLPLAGLLMAAVFDKSGAVIERDYYSMGFFSGLIACVVWILSVAYLWVQKRKTGFMLFFGGKGSGSLTHYRGKPYLYLFLLPIETGLIGLVAFSSPYRYFALLLTLLGGIGAIKMERWMRAVMQAVKVRSRDRHAG